MSPGVRALPLLLMLGFPLCCCHLRDLVDSIHGAEAHAGPDCCNPQPEPAPEDQEDPGCRCSDRVGVPIEAEPFSPPATVCETAPASELVRIEVDRVAPAARSWRARRGG